MAEDSAALKAREPARPLAEIYGELGTALLQLGEERSGAGQTRQAEVRFAEAIEAFTKAIREGGSLRRFGMGLARVQERRSRPEDALRAYLDVVRSEPSSAPEILPLAHRCLTVALARELGHWIDSEWRPAVLRADMEPQATTFVQEFLARVALYRGEFRAAVEDYRAARVVRPDDPFLLEGLGEALWRVGQASEAISILESVVWRADHAGKRERSVRARLKLGGAYVDAGRPQAAINVLRDALSLGEPWRSQLWTSLARARLALGRWDGAVRAAERASEGDDPLASAQAIRAAALLEQFKYQEAVDAAEAALTIDPRDPVATRVEARALIDGSIDIDQGIRLMRQYLEQSPNDTTCRIFLALAMRSAGHPVKDVIAVLDAGASTESGDKPAELYLELAEAYKDAGDAESALRNLERPGINVDRGRWWRLRGDVLRLGGDVTASLNAYAQASRLDPSDLSALERRASLLVEHGRFAEAVQEWQQATEAWPDSGKLKLNLALAAQRAGDGQLAWAAVTEAINTGVYGDDRGAAFVLKAELAISQSRPRDELVAACYEAGREFYWKGEYDRSLVFLDRAREHSGARWYRVDAMRCQAYKPSRPYRDASRMREARRQWETALELGPPGVDEAWAYMSGAYIAEDLGNLDPASESARWMWEAIALTERSLALDDRNIFAWLMLARLHRGMGNQGNALEAATRAMSIDANNLSAIDELAAILSDRGEAARARELIDKRRARERNSWTDGVHAYVLYLESLEQREGQKSRDYLRDAVEQLSAVVQTAPDNLWAFLFRAGCLRRLALRDPTRAEDYRRRARDDFQTVWERRNESAFVGQERAFAEAAYGLGEVPQALAIIECLLDDPADSSCDDYRAIGCYYLRLGDFKRAEENLNRGIDRAVAPPQLEWLELQFSEIEQEAADKEDRGEILALANRVRARMDRVRTRVKQPPSSKAELRRFIEWEEAARRTHGWSWIAANAGLARLCVQAGELREAEAIYRALGQRAGSFPEAGAGLAKIAARCRELGEEAIKKGWDQSQARPMAIEHFEHALAIKETAWVFNRSALCVRLGIAQFIAGLEQQAAETLAAAVKAFEVEGEEDPGAALGRICRELISGVAQFWTLDGFLRSLAENPGTPEPLCSVLAQAVETLGDYLENALDMVKSVSQEMLPVVTPIAIEIAKNLVVPEDQEKDWPMLKQFLAEMQDRIEDETGVSVPRVRVRGNESDLPDDTYVIMLDEVPIVSGNISPAARYCPSSAGALQAVGVPLDELKETKHPISMQPGWWVPERYWERVQKAEDCTLWPDRMQFAVAHLEAVLRSNLTDFVGVQEVSNLLERWGRMEKGRELIAAALPDTLTRQRFVRLLRALLRERVPITNWERILEAVGEAGLENDEIDHAVRHVRLRIKNDLPGNEPGAKLVSVPTEIESAVLRWVTTVDGRRFLAIPPEATQDLLAKVRALVSQDDPAVLLVTERQDVRAPLRRLIELEFPHVAVQWREETLDEEQRQSPLGRIPVIAEWSESGNQGVEAEHAG